MPLSKERDEERKRLVRAYVQPKYQQGYLYPDGRVRLEDMSVVQPNQCFNVKIIALESLLARPKVRSRW